MATPAWQPQPTPAVAPSNHTSPIVLVLVVLLVVALGVGGFFAYKKFFAPAKLDQPPAPEQQAAPVQPVEAAPGGAGEQALSGSPSAPDSQSTAQMPAPASGHSSVGGAASGARASTPPPDSASSAPAATEPPPPAPSAPAAVPASEPAPAAAPVQEQTRVQILKPETPLQPQSPPAAPPAKHAYSGPPAGVLLWSGRLEKNGSVTIDGNSASLGNLTGELPGVPVMIEVDQREFALAETPSPSNGWKRITIRSRGKRHSVVSIQWSILK